MLKSRLYIYFLVVSAFIISWCNDEYWQYQQQNNRKIELEQKAKIDSQQFEVDKIENRDLEVYSSPDKTIIDKIVEKINWAKTRIYLETYIFTEKRILKAILDAKKRWVDIKIILEKNVLWSWNINKKAFDSLINSWVEVKYSNSKNYVFTHAKFFLIDSSYIISTGNVSYSTYSSNKEFFIFGNTKEDLNVLDNVFTKDFTWEKLILCNQSLVISPICPRYQILETLKSAKNEIMIFEQSIDDLEIQNILLEKAKNWIKIQMLIWDTKVVKTNKEIMEKFLENWIDIKAPKKPYVHAKAFMVDNKYLFVWSINFTYNSIENNREIGLIFTNWKISEYFKNEFERLFANTQ